MNTINHQEIPVYCTFQDAPAHHYRGHPEAPSRLQPLASWLENDLYPEIEVLDYRSAAEGEVMLVHDPSLLSLLRQESAKGSHEFEPSPTYVTENSYEMALGAVGATLAISRKILAEGTGRGFAIVRPPGHHAGHNEAMGFCLLNNLAVAAADAVASGLRRVAILDVDAHHGNGTQSIFWNTSEVGYLSIHERNIFPGSGAVNEAPHALGRIINVPLPSFSGNSVYEDVFEHVVKPWLFTFEPEMIFVSSGFDTHFSDPLTTLSLDTQGIFSLSQKVLHWADVLCEGRVMYVLEGGYDPIALSDNIQACLAAMSGHEITADHYGTAPELRTSIHTLIEDLVRRHHLEEI
jgi:acetoin utilization deacetylase AcuC-like enzyme